MPRSLTLLLFVFFGCAQGAGAPPAVTAQARAGGVAVSWEPRGGTRFSVQPIDLDSGAPLGAALETSAAEVLLPGPIPDGAGVSVEARDAQGGPLWRARGYVTAGSEGGSGAAWQLFGPSDYRDGVLQIDFADLQPGEELAVLLLDAGGPDGAQATLRISGAQQQRPKVSARLDATGPSLAPSAPGAGGGFADGPSLLLSGLTPAAPAPAALPLRPLHEKVRHAQDALFAQSLASGRSPARAETTPQSFCAVPGLDFSSHQRRSATQVFETAHAIFLADTQDLAQYAPYPDFWSALGATFEQRGFSRDAQLFGAPSDVDQNGKILVFFTSELGRNLNGGWLIGYFGSGDLLGARDSSPDCSQGGSNHAEILYMNSLADGLANGWSEPDLVSSIYPETLAHELQHLINLNLRCLEHSCAAPELTWINEALSKVAEDEAGYGWSTDRGRQEGARYLSRTIGSQALRGYDGRSLTQWEGDPIGNYQGAHSFLRYFTDKVGLSLLAALAQGQGGKPGLEDALGMPLPRAMAEWATALAGGAPGKQFAYSGAAWSPLPARLGRLELAPLTDGLQLALRTDGLAGLQSGPGLGGPVGVRVQSAAAPHVVVLRRPGN